MCAGGLRKCHLPARMSAAGCRILLRISTAGLGAAGQESKLDITEQIRRNCYPVTSEASSTMSITMSSSELVAAQAGSKHSTCALMERQGQVPEVDKDFEDNHGMAIGRIPGSSIRDVRTGQRIARP
eukprot:2207246-Rhodomonas_salina.1